MKEGIPLLDLRVFQKEIKISVNFLQKSFEKPDLKLKGVSSGNSQVSTPFYSTKAESSSPYGRTANEEEEVKPVSPSFSDFQTTVETPVFESQLRVLNKSFEIDMITCLMNLNLLKTKTKEKPTKLFLIKKKKIVLKESEKNK